MLAQLLELLSVLDGQCLQLLDQPTQSLFYVTLVHLSALTLILFVSRHECCHINNMHQLGTESTLHPDFLPRALETSIISDVEFGLYCLGGPWL